MIIYKTHERLVSAVFVTGIIVAVSCIPTLSYATKTVVFSAQDKAALEEMISRWATPLISSTTKKSHRLIIQPPAWIPMDQKSIVTNSFAQGILSTSHAATTTQNYYKPFSVLTTFQNTPATQAVTHAVTGFVQWLQAIITHVVNAITRAH